ncbi:hypothetical protein FQA39_LY16788 [Lamprigera yunnana]|nr:hypothetical protein FQA39_LY16788 [Lamprigera yunnana]
MSCQIRETQLVPRINGLPPLVEFGEDKIILPIKYKEYHERINKFEVRDSDIYLAGYPKSGTTWAQEMIWLIVNGLNYKGAEEDLLKRCPNIELPIYREQMNGENFITYLNEMPSPRCIRTHLPWQLLPEQIKNGSKKPKIIHIFRIPEDVCVSYYHHFLLVGGYGVGLDKLCRLFLSGLSLCGPFWKTVLSFWHQRQNSNMLFITYENMKKNLAGTIKDVAKFLQRNLNEDDMEKLLNHLSVKSMKTNNAVNLIHHLNHNQKSSGEFIRSGVAGGYKSEMTEDQIEAFKKWTQENLLDTESGTNMGQEMIWLIVNGLNYKGAEEDLLKRCPNLELPIYREQINGENFITYLNEMPSPRCIRTHLPWQLLPEQIKNGSKKPKIIHIFRVPEDVCVSYYNHFVLVRGYGVGLDKLCRLFLSGLSLCGPFWKTVLSFWHQRQNSDMLFITYENMKKNLAGTIKDVAKFLQRNINEDDMEKLLNHLSVKSMKTNNAVNMIHHMNHNQKSSGEFIHSGVAGRYKSEMTEDQTEAFKKWTQENLVGVDFEFTTNL